MTGCGVRLRGAATALGGARPGSISGADVYCSFANINDPNTSEHLDVTPSDRTNANRHQSPSPRDL
jgi:hypothetical protein